MSCFVVCICFHVHISQPPFNRFAPLSAPAKISLTLPNGTSTSELLSPNYPNSFPNDAEMEWAFQVPLNHRAAVEFRSFTQPQCREKETEVQYLNITRYASVLSLDEAQPQQCRGSFSMILRNCEMDRSSASGLSLNFTVTVSSFEGKL